MVSHCAYPTRVFGDRALHEHRRPSSLLSLIPSKLAWLSSLGRAPMLVYVRPSNEALPRARVPGAQDQRGCPSHSFYRGGSASKKDVCLFPHTTLAVLRCSSACTRSSTKSFRSVW